MRGYSSGNGGKVTEMSPLTQVNGFCNNFVIKEYFHKMFNCTNRLDKEFLCECYEWAYQIKAVQIMKWIWSIMDDERLWNYFEYKVTTGLSEGINRAIKGLKWQAYGYKDMLYFSLKILQKVGYLNHRYILAQS